jgi:hypothetical protein
MKKQEFRLISGQEIQKLCRGDTVFVREGEELYESLVLSPPVWSRKAQGSVWSVETAHGVVGKDRLYIMN